MLPLIVIYTPMGVNARTGREWTSATNPQAYAAENADRAEKRKQEEEARGYISPRNTVNEREYTNPAYVGLRKMLGGVDRKAEGYAEREAELMLIKGDDGPRVKKTVSGEATFKLLADAQKGEPTPLLLQLQKQIQEALSEERFADANCAVEIVSAVNSLLASKYRDGYGKNGQPVHAVIRVQFTKQVARGPVREMTSAFYVPVNFGDLSQPEATATLPYDGGAEDPQRFDGALSMLTDGIKRQLQHAMDDVVATQSSREHV